MHNQAVLYPQQQHHAASTICFRDTNSSHQFIWSSILNMHPCMSHERQHRRQTSNRMVCCTLHAAISQQPLPRGKQHPSQRQTVSAMLATSRPAHTVRSTDVKQQKKNAFMSRYATHQQRQRHHNLQLASVAATVLSTNTMMRWRSTTQLPVPLQYITTTSASQRHHSAASITFPNMQARQCADVNETG